MYHVRLCRLVRLKSFVASGAAFECVVVVVVVVVVVEVVVEQV